MVDTRALIEARMKPAPVIRFTGSPDFNNATPEQRARVMQDWITEELQPLLNFSPTLRHALGMDFARTGDLSAIAPSQIATNHVTIPFIVEMKNVPYNQQLQVLFAIGDAFAPLGRHGDRRPLATAAMWVRLRMTDTALWWCG